MCSRLDDIKTRVQAAALRAGRDASEVNILAVSKKKPASMVRELFQCGQQWFGENYVQEAVVKIDELADIRHEIQWHFIGHLQRNKAKLAVQYFDCIETVDSLKLARAIDRHAGNLGKTIDCLCQVNIGMDQAKSGVAPSELPELLSGIRELQSIRARGLMTIHPWSSSKDDVRRWFRQMRELRDDMVSQALLPAEKGFCHISMGMSGDFEEAVEEGATIVRIGTALFGPRE